MRKLMGEILHFGIIGVINTILGFVLIMVFYNIFYWNYWMASGTSYVIGGVCSYFANKKLTFKAEEEGLRPAIRFAVNLIICYFIAYGIAKPAVRNLLAGYSGILGEKIGMDAQAVEENVAIIAGMGLFTVFNFIGQKCFVFKNRSKNEKG